MTALQTAIPILDVHNSAEAIISYCEQLCGNYNQGLDLEWLCTPRPSLLEICSVLTLQSFTARLDVAIDQEIDQELHPGK